MSSRRFEPRTFADLLSMPDPRWIVPDLLMEGALALVVGASGAGKSFFLTYLAIFIATGRRWPGAKTATQRQPVIYVLGEGQRSFKHRVLALALKLGIDDLDDLYFVLDAPQFSKSGDVDTLIARIKELKLQGPITVIIDTLARSAVGVDENSAMETGELIANATRLQTLTNATVIFAHHTGKAGDIERGSSAIGAAMDTKIQIARDSERAIRVSCTKQKDAEPFAPMTFRLESFALGRDSSNTPITSCVLEPCDVASETDAVALPVLQMLASFPNATALTGAWRRKMKLPERTFERRRDQLIERGLVVKTSIRGEYRLTENGRAALRTEKNRLHHQSAA
jgi:hypothetical protein